MVRQGRGTERTAPAARREHGNSHEEVLLGQSGAGLVRGVSPSVRGLEPPGK